MSELENLCHALEECVQPLSAFAGTLQQRAARLRSVAAEVEQAARQLENGPNVRHVVQELHEAAAAMDASSRSLATVVGHSRMFVTRTIGGGGAGTVANSIDGTFGYSGQGSNGIASNGASDARLSLPAKRATEPEWAPGSGDGYLSELASVPAYSSPEGWAHSINGGGIASAGRHNNCIDCARSVESTWRGAPTQSAAMADASANGTAATRVTEWSGGTFQTATYGDIDKRLNELGDGSSAVVVSSWSRGRGAHAFNAINDSGTVKFVDGQSGTVSGWPPNSWYESQVAATWVVFFDGNANPV